MRLVKKMKKPTFFHYFFVNSGVANSVEPHINGGAQTACAAGMQGQCPTSVEIDELTV